MSFNSIYPTTIFTRYLYELPKVKYSLECALIEKKREEVLYWAYELYHSGFQIDVWNLVRDLYVLHYEEHNPKFRTHLDRLYLQWKENGDACLLGTVVGTLALRDRIKGAVEKFIILYKDDRHQTQDVVGKPRNYLKQVTKYPIRTNHHNSEDIEIRKIKMNQIKEAYLGPNWLYYCAETPIWISRIKECRGNVAKDKEEIVFETDDDLEEFYEKWGFEPDEQCLEMHYWHIGLE